MSDFLHENLDCSLTCCITSSLELVSRILIIVGGFLLFVEINLDGFAPPRTPLHSGQNGAQLSFPPVVLLGRVVCGTVI